MIKQCEQNVQFTSAFIKKKREKRNVRNSLRYYNEVNTIFRHHGYSTSGSMMKETRLPRSAIEQTPQQNQFT